jgi:DNA polymerase-3 subunit epsilon
MRPGAFYGYDPSRHAEHRREVAQWAADLFRRDAVIFDSETTGLGPHDEFVQLGVIDLQGNIVLDTLVRPSRPIPPDATAIHHLTNDDVAGAPAFPELYEALRDAIGGRTVIVYNADYDRRILWQTCRLYDLPMIEAGRWYCAMKYYARFYGAWNSRFGDFRWHKLAVACANEGVPVGRAHAAVEDCRLTLALLRKMAAAIE